MGTAGEHDNLRAHELCAGVALSEIVIFSKAYVDFAHLADLSMCEVFWVARAKENLCSWVRRRLQLAREANILRDDLIELSSAPSKKNYPVELRRVSALLEAGATMLQAAITLASRGVSCVEATCFPRDSVDILVTGRFQHSLAGSDEISFTLNKFLLV